MRIGHWKKKHHFTLIIILMIPTCTLVAQEYDPFTGEQISAKSDTTEIMSSQPVFDPETGEMILTNHSELPAKLEYEQQNSSLSSEKASPGPEWEKLCQKARNDGKKETGVLWYIGGLAYFSGVVVNQLIEPTPKNLAAMQLSPEETILYLECYTNAAYKERRSRMLTGCGSFIALMFLTDF